MAKQPPFALRTQSALPIVHSHLCSCSDENVVEQCTVPTDRRVPCMTRFTRGLGIRWWKGLLRLGEMRRCDVNGNSLIVR